jgi:hypothetical protein
MRNGLVLFFLSLTVISLGCIHGSGSVQNMDYLLSKNIDSEYRVNYSFKHQDQSPDFSLVNRSIVKYDRNGRSLTVYRTEMSGFLVNRKTTATTGIYKAKNGSYTECSSGNGLFEGCRDRNMSAYYEGGFALYPERLKEVVSNYTYLKTKEKVGRKCSLFDVEFTEAINSDFDGSNPENHLCIDQKQGYTAYIRTNTTLLGERQLDFRYQVIEYKPDFQTRLSPPS